MVWFPDRRRWLVACATAPWCVPAPAAEYAYEADAFAAALKGGGPVAIAFETDWCAVCSAQKPVILQLLDEPRFAAMKLFMADFDHDLAIRRRLRVTVQSTLVVFRGRREVARAAGLTRRADLAALLARAL
jgi:thiol-disulfide isomerase/thioredoxin